VLYNNSAALLHLSHQVLLVTHGLVAAVLAISIRRWSSAKHVFGLERRSVLSGIRWGGVVSVTVIALVLAGTRARLISYDDRTDHVGIEQRMVDVLIWTPLGVAFFEEFLFRGLLYRYLRKRRSRAFAIFLTAALFAVAHLVQAE
jgi:membrane protease YdiL (CAAX protease family)